MASGNGTGYLRDDEGGHVELGILLAVTDQRAGNLLGGHQADVGYEVAVNRVRHVDVEDDAGEVGAIVKEQIEVADVVAVVEVGDESPVLCRRAIDLEAVDGSIERGAYKFGPLSFRGFAVLVVRCKLEQVLSAIGLAPGCDLFSVHLQGNVVRRIDRVKIADQGHRDPVIAVDLVIAADDDAKLAVVAGAKHGGRIGADVVEIDGGVAGGTFSAPNVPYGSSIRSATEALAYDTAAVRKQRNRAARRRGVVLRALTILFLSLIIYEPLTGTRHSSGVGSYFVTHVCRDSAP